MSGFIKIAVFVVVLTAMTPSPGMADVFTRANSLFRCATFAEEGGMPEEKSKLEGEGFMALFQKYLAQSEQTHKEHDSRLIYAAHLAGFNQGIAHAHASMRIDPKFVGGDKAQNSRQAYVNENCGLLLEGIRP